MSVLSSRSVLVDLLRTFAIVAVLAIHLQASGLPSNPPNRLSAFLWGYIAPNGGNGVQVFFVLSGFLITSVLARRNSSLFTIDLRDFYTRRLARLLPLLLVVLAIGVILSTTTSVDEAAQFCFSARRLDLVFWLSLPTFTFNWLRIALSRGGVTYGLHWDVLWSLAVEEQFYLFYPLLLHWAATPRRLASALGGFIFFGLLVRGLCWLLAPQHLYLGLLNSFGCFDLMALGCLAYLLRGQAEKLLTSTARVGLTLAATSILLWGFAADKAAGSAHIWGPSVLGFSVFLLLVSGVELSGKFWGLLTLPGRLSYGIYLLHGLVLFYLWPYLQNIEPIRGLALFLGVVVAVGWFSSNFLEEPANHQVLKQMGVGSTTT